MIITYFLTKHSCITPERWGLGILSGTVVNSSLICFSRLCQRTPTVRLALATIKL